jgi:molybdenum cofactor cytidylyltransferase
LPVGPSGVKDYRTTLERMSVAAIILAAGASHRLGQPKQLLEFRGEPLLERAIRIATESGVSSVFTVLGANFEVICASLDFKDAILVANDQWQKGMATSIHAGLRAMEAAAPHATGVLLMSCDQPLLTADHLRTLIGAFEAQPPPAIVCSSYGGVHGVPAIFPREIVPRLRALRGDKGARAILAQPPCSLIAREFPGGAIDIDLPADLAHLK